MCGRYVITYTLDELRALFAVEDRPNFEPHYNAAPSQSLPVIRRGKTGEPRLSLIRWGLVPHWSKDGPEHKSPPINARSETAGEKPMFRTALARRRAIVPANGFYEWAKTAEGKQPYFITRTDNAPLAFAALWERWGEGEAAFDSFAILTGPANNDIANLHHRCPILITPDNQARWLDPECDPNPFLSPPPDGTLTARAVSKAVNNVRNSGPELIEPVNPA